MNTNNKIARIAGFLYFMYIVISIIGNEFGRFVSVDAPATVNYIMAHASPFRIGFLISLFSVVPFLLAAWALYVLLKPVNENIALLFLLLNLGGFAIWCVSMLNLIASLLLLISFPILFAIGQHYLSDPTFFGFAVKQAALIIGPSLGHLMLPLNSSHKDQPERLFTAQLF